MQGRNLSTLQPPPSRLKQFSCLSLLISWDYKRTPSSLANFCIFSRNSVLSCWPGWSRIPDFKSSIHLPWSLKSFVFLHPHTGDADLDFSLGEAELEGLNTDNRNSSLQQHFKAAYSILSANSHSPFSFLEMESPCHPGWSTVAQSRLTATSTSQDQAILLLSLRKTGFHHVGQAGLKLLTSGDLSILASQSTGNTGMSHQARPEVFFF
ncbi:hypothetical protein AAY473_008026, partial [Plecturocebus cupreus]